MGCKVFSVVQTPILYCTAYSGSYRRCHEDDLFESFVVTCLHSMDGKGVVLEMAAWAFENSFDRSLWGDMLTCFAHTAVSRTGSWKPLVLNVLCCSFFCCGRFSLLSFWLFFCYVIKVAIQRSLIFASSLIFALEVLWSLSLSMSYQSGIGKNKFKIRIPIVLVLGVNLPPFDMYFIFTLLVSCLTSPLILWPFFPRETSVRGAKIGGKNLYATSSSICVSCGYFQSTTTEHLALPIGLEYWFTTQVAWSPRWPLIVTCSSDGSCSSPNSIIFWYNLSYS